MQYTVQAGDSLSLISKKFYGDFSMVDAIAQANNIGNKDLIYPGIKLVLPDVVKTNSPQIEDAVVVDDGKKKSNAWLWWVLLGAAAGGGYYIYKRKQRAKKSRA